MKVTRLVFGNFTTCCKVYLIWSYFSINIPLKHVASFLCRNKSKLPLCLVKITFLGFFYVDSFSKQVFSWVQRARCRSKIWSIQVPKILFFSSCFPIFRHYRNKNDWVMKKFSEPNFGPLTPTNYPDKLAKPLIDGVLARIKYVYGGNYSLESKAWRYHKWIMNFYKKI